VYESWQGIYFFTKISRPVLGPTNYAIEWVVRRLSGSEVAIVRLTIHLHLVLRLRINTDIRLLSQHAFMVWTGTT
jgi:hypothetical protein